MVDRARRILGLTFDDEPIREPNPAASAIVFAAMGGGKTTCVAVPTIEAMLPDLEQGLIINDVKDGEIAAQIGAMCVKHGRKFGVIDDFDVLGADYPWKLGLNPFGAVQAAGVGGSDLPFVMESTMHTLIEEPPNDTRNRFWRDGPRDESATALKLIHWHRAATATPGGLYAFVADAETFETALKLEADDPGSPFRHECAQILAMKRDNPEHYSQHTRAALTALKIFASPPLSEAGRGATITHEQLLREKWVVCIVSPVRHADRLGPYFALHVLSFMQAQLSGRVGRTCMILDEYCNAPLREAVNRITVFRAFGMKALFITQSRQDSVRKYGERETAILEENCGVKQWLKISNFEEAERLSRAIGESISVSPGLNVNSDRAGFSASMNMGRQRLFTADELMNLPDDEQILHVTGVGFIHCKKIRQNEIAPYCFDLADNPLEGGRLDPNPKVWLTPKQGGFRWPGFRFLKRRTSRG